MGGAYIGGAYIRDFTVFHENCNIYSKKVTSYSPFIMDLNSAISCSCEMVAPDGPGGPGGPGGPRGPRYF